MAKHTLKILLWSHRRILKVCLAIFQNYEIRGETLKLPSYRNQSIDLQSKSSEWFLYDDDFGI